MRDKVSLHSKMSELYIYVYNDSLPVLCLDASYSCSRRWRWSRRSEWSSLHICLWSSKTSNPGIGFAKDTTPCLWLSKVIICCPVCGGLSHFLPASCLRWSQLPEHKHGDRRRYHQCPQSPHSTIDMIVNAIIEATSTATNVVITTSSAPVSYSTNKFEKAILWVARWPWLFSICRNSQHYCTIFPPSQRRRLFLTSSALQRSNYFPALSNSSWLLWSYDQQCHRGGSIYQNTRKWGFPQGVWASSVSSSCSIHYSLVLQLPLKRLVSLQDPLTLWNSGFSCWSTNPMGVISSKYMSIIVLRNSTWLTVEPSMDTLRSSADEEWFLVKSAWACPLT